MKLDAPFIKLPVRFDVARLKAEIAQFEESDWRVHPQKFYGNSALRLITRDGGDNDDLAGRMLPTEHLWRSPYIRQIIRSFGVVVSRSRLMRLAPQSTVPEHSDINFHWFNRVRIHIPIITNDKVFFHCDGQVVNMKEGEAWIFDNWRSHRVENQSDVTRIHLVIDTVGSSAFWNLSRHAHQLSSEQLASQTKLLPYRYADDAHIATESDSQPAILDPYGLKYLCADFHSDLSCPTPHPEADACIKHFCYALTTLCEDWSALYALHGGNPDQRPAFQALLDRTRRGLESIPLPLQMKSNGIVAKDVFLTRVVQGALNPLYGLVSSNNQPASTKPNFAPHFDRPIFIVAAPRSGSTLLYETLAKHPGLKSLGDESHEVIDGVAGFNPATGAVPDNELTEAALDQVVAAKITAAFWRGLRDNNGLDCVVPIGRRIRFLEKTPKNSLRIRFLHALFPDAKFIFLHRDPRANIASMIEAWKSGNWVTYPRLPGREQPWSLLLPPGWRDFNRASIEEIAAFQWQVTNDAIMRDLAVLPANQVATVSYEDFLRRPQAVTESLLRFAELTNDADFLARLSQPLPFSKYTLTAPDERKWLKHAEALNRFESRYVPTQQRIDEWCSKRSS